MKRLLLAGGGHAHMAVLHALGRERISEVEVTLVAPTPRWVYSAMVPGWIAGHYGLEQMLVGLAPLAARAGANFVLAHVARIDFGERIAYTENSQTLPFDALSLNTGPVFNGDAVPGLGEHAIAPWPAESFVLQWQRLHARLATEAMQAGDPLTVSVLGGGAAGVEVSLAIAYRVALARMAVRVQLVSGHDGVLPALAPSVRARAQRQLIDASVRVIIDNAIEVNRHTIMLDQGGELATGATLAFLPTVAADWPRESGLAVDEHGFVAVNANLQSLSHPFVFAAGDCASIRGAPRPKSGVYAVRAGATLAGNLRRFLRNEGLRRHAPPTRALYLLSAGAQYAIGSWGSIAFEGAWAWRWKDRIDREFVARHRAPI